MNKLFMISGSSGVGKSTIVNKLSDNIIMSFTTREPRQGEINGVDYHYISKEQFDYMQSNNELAEWTEYGGNFYGLIRDEIESKLIKGSAFVIVDYNGMKQLKELYPDSVSIFIYTTKDDCIMQMRMRGDSNENILKRLDTYDEEMKNRVHYDYVVKNKRGQLNECIKVVRSIVEYETGEVL